MRDASSEIHSAIADLESSRLRIRSYLSRGGVPILDAESALSGIDSSLAALHRALRQIERFR